MYSGKKIAVSCLFAVVEDKHSLTELLVTRYGVACWVYPLSNAMCAFKSLYQETTDDHDIA